ncbi:MAG: hypothetical protein AB7P12_00725 [Alphaproteobacteria bacterium]
MSDKSSRPAAPAAPKSAPVAEPVMAPAPSRERPARVAAPPPVGGSRTLAELESLAREHPRRLQRDS